MGMCAYVEMSLNQRSWDAVAKAVGLPETIVDDSCCYLTAKAAKQADEVLERWYKDMQNGETICLQTLNAIKAMEFVVAHAKAYISAKSSEACGIQFASHRERKDWFRKATKEYRLYFA